MKSWKTNFQIYAMQEMPHHGEKGEGNFKANICKVKTYLPFCKQFANFEVQVNSLAYWLGTLQIQEILKKNNSNKPSHTLPDQRTDQNISEEARKNKLLNPVFVFHANTGLNFTKCNQSSIAEYNLLIDWRRW